MEPDWDLGVWGRQLRAQNLTYGVDISYLIHMAVCSASTKEKYMKLVYEGSNIEVQIGDVVHVDNIPYYIENIVEPHKPSSSGRVWCRSMTEEKYFKEWFPSVIRAVWIDREDHRNNPPVWTHIFDQAKLF